ncbi:MAG: glutamate--tRNA ligase [Bacilli bacterium]|jgi:nondiscriminating glutamyl-tRNA synthetase
MKEVRTRFAPSPTGFMHIGGVRTALYAYLIAKQNNGKFILRIEDTDQQRYVEGAIEVIYSTLRDLGLIWDEGPDIGGPYAPYIQSERKNNYIEYAEKLVNEGKAYYCFCDEKRLDELKAQAEQLKVPYKYDGHCRNLSLEEARAKIKNGEKYVIRFKMPREGITTFNDYVYGEVTVDNAELEDLIMIKSDGMATYNFANIIDDHSMAISHVVRGNEYVSSTPKYILIYKALGWDVPEFVHLPIIKKAVYSDKKLSKRDGDATVEALKAKGYLNEAIINMLALTGWSPGDERELFTLNELVKIFDPRKISKGNAIFDVNKLNWINSQYMKKLSDEEIYELTIPHLKQTYNVNDKDIEWLKAIVKLYRNQISYGQEIVTVALLFFKEDIVLDDECVEFMKQDGVVKVIDIFSKEIAKIDNWTIDNIAKVINNTKEITGIGGKLLYMSIRIKVTGQMHGPELPNTIQLLGKDLVLNRLLK